MVLEMDQDLCRAPGSVLAASRLSLASAEVRTPARRPADYARLSAKPRGRGAARAVGKNATSSAPERGRPPDLSAVEPGLAAMNRRDFPAQRSRAPRVSSRATVYMHCWTPATGPS